MYLRYLLCKLSRIYLHWQKVIGSLLWPRWYTFFQHRKLYTGNLLRLQYLPGCFFIPINMKTSCSDAHPVTHCTFQTKPKKDVLVTYWMRTGRVQRTWTVHCSNGSMGYETHLLQQFCPKYAGLMPHLHCISVKYLKVLRTVKAVLWKSNKNRKLWLFRTLIGTYGTCLDWKINLRLFLVFCLTWCAWQKWKEIG